MSFWLTFLQSRIPPVEPLGDCGRSHRAASVVLVGIYTYIYLKYLQHLQYVDADIYNIYIIQYLKYLYNAGWQPAGRGVPGPGRGGRPGAAGCRVGEVRADLQPGGGGGVLFTVL